MLIEYEDSATSDILSRPEWELRWWCCPRLTIFPADGSSSQSILELSGLRALWSWRRRLDLSADHLRNARLDWNYYFMLSLTWGLHSPLHSKLFSEIISSTTSTTIANTYNLPHTFCSLSSLVAHNFFS